MKTQKKQHAFSSDYQYFRKIPQSQRSKFRQQILSLQPLIGQPKNYKQQYPYSKKFIHQGIQLNYYHSEKNQNTKAVFFSFHGMNSHGAGSGFLSNSIKKSLNLDTYALDFRNFGLSKGDNRGYIHSFDEAVQEADAFIDHVVTQYLHKPKVIISGLSFGGTICFKMAITKPLKYNYLIMFSPGLRQVTESMPVMKSIGKAIGYLFPTLQTVQPKFTDGNKYFSEALIKSDPRNYLGKVIPGSVRTVLNAIQQVSTEYQKLSMPYLLIQSGKDKLVDLFAPLDLEDKAQTKDKTTVYYKDMWHSVYSQEQIKDIVPIVIDWIKQRI